MSKLVSENRHNTTHSSVARQDTFDAPTGGQNNSDGLRNRLSANPSTTTGMKLLAFSLNSSDSFFLTPLFKYFSHEQTNPIVKPQQMSWPNFIHIPGDLRTKAGFVQNATQP